MKRKAEEELLSQRVAPPVQRDGYPPQLPGKGLSTYGPRHDGADMSGGEDVESLDDGGTENTEGGQSTPVTTAVSTASRRFPSDLKTIKCTWPNCTKTFNRPARLTAHLRSHNNDRPFRCGDCAKTYMEEKHLRQHVKGSHSQERRYVCDACSRAFLTATRLRRHAAVHEGQDRFRCRGYDDACTRTFRKHQTLQRHIRVDHLGQPAFVCSRLLDGTSGGGGRDYGGGDDVAGMVMVPLSATCGMLFESAGALRRHIAREHGTAKYWCEECLASEDAGGVGTGRSVDDDDDDYDYDYDENHHAAAAAAAALPRRAGFATKALLEAHMRQEHVSCLFCDARCAGPAALHRHIDMYHSGKTVADRKTTVCPHDRCGKSFTRRANLNVHIRAAHEGLRFVCGDLDALGSTSSSSVAEAEAEDDDEDDDEDEDEDDSPRVDAAAAVFADPQLALWDAHAHGCGRGFVSKMKLEEHVLYVHLRRERPLPVATATTPTASAFLDDLAGTRRTLSCPLAGCSARFARHHDLRAHQLREHAGPEAEAEAEAEAVAEDRYPLLLDTHDGFYLSADAELVQDGSTLFDMYLDLGLTPSPLEESAVQSDEAQWQMDEAEMRRLIGDGCGGNETTGLLDPKLFA